MRPSRVAAALPEYRAVTEGASVVLRPAGAVEGPVAVRFFAGEGDRLEALAVEAEHEAAGALRVKGTAAEIVGSRGGSWRLIAVVGRPDVLASGGASLAKGEAARGAGWQRVEVAVGPK
jgi:hypothetical protein